MPHTNTTSPTIPTPSLATSPPKSGAANDDSFEVLIDLLASDGTHCAPIPANDLPAHDGSHTALRDRTGRLDMGKIRSMFEAQSQAQDQPATSSRSHDVLTGASTEQHVPADAASAEPDDQHDLPHTSRPYPYPHPDPTPLVQQGATSGNKHLEVEAPVFTHDTMITPFCFDELNDALKSAQDEVLGLRRKYDELRTVVSTRFGKPPGGERSPQANIPEQDLKGKLVNPLIHDAASPSEPFSHQVSTMHRPTQVTSPPVSLKDISSEINQLSEEKMKTILSTIIQLLGCSPTSLLTLVNDSGSSGNSCIEHRLQDISRALKFVEHVDQMVWRRPTLQANCNLEPVFSDGNLAALTARLQLWEKVVRGS